MELYATGHNAWHQLQFKDPGSTEEPDDISTFTSVLSTDDAILSVRPFSSYTAVYIKNNLNPQLAGLLPQTHQLLLETRPEIYHNLVEASNNIIVAPSTSSPNTLHQHQSLTSFLLNENPPTSVPLNLSPNTSISQLISYETGFAALTSTAEVYTWGDERYSSCLGRDVNTSSTALIPGLVPDLLDLPTGPITKISAGGYTLAALTVGNDLYLWGDLGRTPTLSSLNLSDRPDPAIVCEEGEEEGKDIADVAVGVSHIIVLTTDGEVYAIGDNTNLQLGIPGVESVKNWTRVRIDFGKQPAPCSIVGVDAGPRNSFLIVRAKH
ncbi:E3 ubiquitin-protein ligase HERC2 [Cladorrhinum sp. PSN259]|nr:E3 ubiquitin-protein ligase HERC2 [Cladorrhinum sp. PSN259]